MRREKAGEERQSGSCACFQRPREVAMCECVQGEVHLSGVAVCAMKSAERSKVIIERKT